MAADNVDEDIDLSRVTEEFVDGGGAADLANRFADDVVNLGTTVVNVLFQTFTVLLFSFYIVAEGPKLRRTVCSFLPPARQRAVLSVWDLAIEKTGGYIFSRGVLAVLSAIAHWIAFEMLNVPFSVPLALWVGIMSQFIPVVGTYIAGALPILITLIDSPRTGVFVLLVVVAYQQVENYLFARRSQPRRWRSMSPWPTAPCWSARRCSVWSGRCWLCRSPPRCRRSSPATDSTSRWKRMLSTRAPRGVGGASPDPVTRA